jgi:hypothetical protein
MQEHANDPALGMGNAAVSWRIERTGDVAFRHFRILQTGKNSHPPPRKLGEAGSQECLACGGLELYGTLMFEIAAPDGADA